MCLIMDADYHPNFHKGKALVADRPIVVYKRLDCVTANGGVSPYQAHKWMFGVMQRVNNFTYRNPIHRYAIDNKNAVSKGLHAFFDKKGLRAKGHSLYPAVIPVGARFWLGWDGEIVSNAMTVYKNMPALLAAHGATKLGAPVSRSKYKKV